MTRMLIVGNWKMHGSRQTLLEIVQLDALLHGHPADFDVAICPPFTLIERARQLGTDFIIGAQDCHQDEAGPYTGCVCAAMLVEVGAALVILGHHERRKGQGETSAQVKAKAKSALAAGLIAVVCVGEHASEHASGQALAIVQAQLRSSVPELLDGQRLVVAYEPAWAIGAGRTPGLDEIATMHAMLRRTLSTMLGPERAAGISLLYGGSVTGANASGLFAIANVDGALVGAASLTAERLAPIVLAAQSRLMPVGQG